MLEVRELTKRYSRTLAVDNVSFTIQPCEILGYLGPNGSGKSTTVKMLTGLLQPTRGEIRFEGRKINHDIVGYKRRLGYVPEEPFLYPYLSGLEYLELTGRLRDMDETVLQRKIADLLHLFALYPDRYSPIASYSKGMRQKILVAAALLHNPDLLIFDEPLSGLDVTTALVFRNLTRTLAANGKMILYSSHVLEVVEKICSNVMILHKGKVVADDSVERLRELMKLPSLEDIFSQLVLQEDTQKIADDIATVMQA